MTVAERNDLLKASIAVDPSNDCSRRFAIRRTESGKLELFDIKFTRMVNGEPEFHGHPAQRVDREVLKSMHARELISEAEYKRLRKELPGC